MQDRYFADRPLPWRAGVEQHFAEAPRRTAAAAPRAEAKAIHAAHRHHRFHIGVLKLDDDGRPASPLASGVTVLGELVSTNAHRRLELDDLDRRVLQIALRTVDTVDAVAVSSTSGSAAERIDDADPAFSGPGIAAGDRDDARLPGATADHAFRK